MTACPSGIRGRKLLPALTSLLVGCFLMVSCDAQLWKLGYPKLQFGGQMLSATQSFPAPFGSVPPMGGVPHDLIIRLKIDSSGPANLAGVSFGMVLPGFVGANNEWKAGSALVKAVQIENDGQIKQSGDSAFAASGILASWESYSMTLTLNLKSLPAEAEFAVVLSSLSFRGGRGPIVPPCLGRDAPVYISSVVSAGEDVPSLSPWRFGAVASIGCFGREQLPIGVTRNSFITAAIGQDPSINSVGMLQTFTVTLVSSLDLASIEASIQSTITISGLNGSQTLDTVALPIDPSSGQFLSSDGKFRVPSQGGAINAGVWTQATGTLKLTINAGEIMAARVPLVFSFKLRLPRTITVSSRVTVEAATGTSTVIPRTEMEHASGNAAPMTTVARSFTTAKIGQSVSGVGQQNTLSITVQANFDLQSPSNANSKIEIHGLVGFATSSSSNQNPIAVVPASADSTNGIFVDDLAAWNRDKGLLAFSIRNNQRLVAGTEYAFQVSLFNPSTPQASPPISIAAIGDTDVPMMLMQKAAGQAAPLFVSSPQLVMATVAQSTTSVGARNTLTITLRSNVGIQTVEASELTGSVSITGLTGFKDVDGNIPIVNRGFNDVSIIFADTAARWTQSTGSLVFVVRQGQQLRAGVLYVFQVVLTNPNTPQVSPAVSISVSGTESIAVRATAIQKTNSSRDPLLIEAPALSTARIGQALTGSAVTNTITVTLQANLLLAAGVRFTIEGLVRSGTVDTGALVIDGCGGVFRSPEGELNRGRWIQGPGSLEVYAAREISSAETIRCSFGLINPSQQQAAPQVFVSVTSFTLGQVSNLIRSIPMRNSPGTRAPFTVLPSTFVVARAGQSVPYPNSQENFITVTLRSNVALASAGAVASTITIEGLTGSQTVDNPRLELVGESFTAQVGQTAVWRQAPGSLAITVGTGRSLVADSEYVFRFKLHNPSLGQPAPMLNISAGGGQVIQRRLMTLDSAGCINSVGDRAPLFVYAPGFLTKEIGMSITAAGSRTAVAVTLRSSVSLTSVAGASTSISITGLTGFADTDNTALPIKSSRDVFTGTASWNQNTGTLTLVVRQNQLMPAGDKDVVVQFELHNGQNVNTPLPVISISGLSATVAPANMTLNGGTLDTKLTTMGRSLKVEFTAVHGISKGDTLLLVLPGVGGGSRSRIYGVTSTPSAFTVEESETAYRDSIASGSSVATVAFRAGFSGKTAADSSLDDGELGSTIKLDTTDQSVFGAHNVYAGTSLRVQGSSLLHSIYHQSAGSAGRPAVAHFYPKYGGSDGKGILRYSAYSVLPQVEMVAKSSVCPGTRVSITLPASSGITVPPGGLLRATISHVKAGTALSAQVGTPSSVSDKDVQYAGDQGRSVQVQFGDAVGMNYAGYQFAPTMMPSPSYVHVDGFRSISAYDPDTFLGDMFTGYGPIRRTALCSSGTNGCSGKLAGGKLDHRRSILSDPASNTLYLTTDVDTFSPPITVGSTLQLGSELLRFTGQWASEVNSVQTPPLKSCTIDGAKCSTAGPLCFTFTFSIECTEPPIVRIVYDTEGTATGTNLVFRGVCTPQDLKGSGDLSYTLTRLPNVVCGDETCPDPKNCRTWGFDPAFPVLQFQRRQFGSTAVALACSAEVVCDDPISPSVAYLQSGGVAALQYTTSPNELDQAGGQKVRLAYDETMDTVVAGSHVSDISLPGQVGSNCVLTSSGLPCSASDMCATIVLSGCVVNPVASVVFANGQVTDIRIGDTQVSDFGAGRGVPGWVTGQRAIGDPPAYGNSLCKRQADFFGSITIAAGVRCDVVPSCGTGCRATLDDQKDVVIVKRTVDPSDRRNFDSGPVDVVRVHAAQSNIGYKVVFVPDLPLVMKPTAIGEDSAVTVALGGTAYSWLDQETGGLIARITPAGEGITNLRVAYARNPDGSVVTYPDECLQACNSTVGGVAVGSRRLSISFEKASSGTAPLLVDIPTIYNNVGLPPLRRQHRRAAAAGFEFRINGNCSCPAYTNSSETSCNVTDPGMYQALLISTSVCAPPAPPPPSVLPATTPVPEDDSGTDTGAIVGGVLGGIGGFILLAAVFWYCTRQKQLPPAPEASKEVPEPVEEGPVFVGRPMPVTPDMIMAQAAYSPRQIFSPGFGPTLGTGNANWSYASNVAAPMQASPVGYQPNLQPSPVSYPPNNAYSPRLFPVAAQPMSPGFAMDPSMMSFQPQPQLYAQAQHAPVSPVVISTPVRSAMPTNVRFSPAQDMGHTMDQSPLEEPHEERAERVPYGV